MPVIPLNQVGAYVECHRCKSQFDVSVLQPNLNRSSMQPGMPALMPPLPGQGMPYANATITQRSNGMATAALVLGIVSLASSFLVCTTFVLVPLALLFGLIGLVQAGKTQTGKGKALAGIICALLAVGVVTMIMLKAKDSAKNAPPPTALESAKRSIAGRPEIRGFGNNAEAKAMAEILAAKMQAIHDTMIESSSGKKTSDQYAVHCELHEKTCAFLIFVPDYRKFESELKDDMNDVAWTMASSAVQNSGKLTAADAELCVGLKGLVMFGSVMTGSPDDEKPKRISAQENELIRFFPEPTPPPSSEAGEGKPPVVEDP